MGFSLLTPDYIIWNLGRSAEGRVLDVLTIAPQGANAPPPKTPQKASWPWVLLLSGVHGDEIEGVWLLEEVRSAWVKQYPFKKVGVILWTQVNPDGVAKATRWNSKHVDLNRNLPTKDWSPQVKNPRYPPGLTAASELETKALIELIHACEPCAVLSVHSFERFQINVNGPATEWANVLAQVCKYPVTEDIGYPTPGSLGTYSGKEKGIPTITLEIEKGLSKDEVLKIHFPVIESALQFWDERVGAFMGSKSDTVL